ncbi:MAG: hypothetical protein AUG51_18615 [Acidobacteria bacterium 13_1_20CM_3_53_8]|nr:MAG: hypothetical protein AUG51_18615 [Acidobacteria bacterium 13_1_20CM_3_53_8]
MDEGRIFPQFKDFVLCFGAKLGDNEVGPPQLRFRCLSASVDETFPDYGTYLCCILRLKHFKLISTECAYVLRFVELNNRNEKAPWSIRQTALYQRYTSRSRTSTMVFVALSNKAEERLQYFIREAGGLAGLNPFEVHLLILDTVMANWRPYMMYLAKETNSQVWRSCS